MDIHLHEPALPPWRSTCTIISPPRVVDFILLTCHIVNYNNTMRSVILNLWIVLLQHTLRMRLKMPTSSVTDSFFVNEPLLQMRYYWGIKRDKCIVWLNSSELKLKPNLNLTLNGHRLAQNTPEYIYMYSIYYYVCVCTEHHRNS